MTTVSMLDREAFVQHRTSMTAPALTLSPVDWPNLDGRLLGIS